MAVVRRTVRTEVDGAVGDGAALVVVDPHREIVPIDQGDCGTPRLATGMQGSQAGSEIPS